MTTTYIAKLDDDVVPSQNTKILFAGQVPVPPIGKLALDGAPL